MSIGTPNHSSLESGLSLTTRRLGPQSSEHRLPQIAARQSLVRALPLSIWALRVLSIGTPKSLLARAPPNRCSPESGLSPTIEHLGPQGSEHRQPQIVPRQSLVRALPLSIWGLRVLSIGTPKLLSKVWFESYH
ncbi:hypothetical protein VNO80_27120 [Phaseolus coccineus]|uniref:Uncharacterized protein n=1 Tax=Phaseolus coccineus TaxID=3886 RepID=A0AAN9LG99_PHACN